VFPLIFSDPTDRLYPLNEKEKTQIKEAYVAWCDQKLFIDSKGHCRLNDENKTYIAPYSNLIVTLFPKISDFHMAARHYKDTGFFTDPTQTLRIVPHSDGTQVEIRLQQGTAVGLKLATVYSDTKQPSTAVDIGELIGHALYSHAQSVSGRKEIQEVIEKVLRNNTALIS
jgi:hypothetical protein